MISNFLKQKKQILLVGIFALLFVTPIFAHAQAATTIDYDTISKSGSGWTKVSGNTASSVWKDAAGDTATCTFVAIDIPGAGGSGSQSCDIQYANGNTGTSDNTITAGGSGTINTAQTTDPRGTVLAATSSASDGTASAAKTIGGLLGNWFFNGAATVVAGIAFIILNLASVILALVGTLFNWVVVYTIFKFGSYFGNSTGLLLGWGILRDIGNILLLFGFVYIGIMVVLDVHGYDVRKTLPRLLIVAVLLNFSLFAAEAVIDVSNVVSASLFATAGQTSVCTTTSAQGCASIGIADQVIQASGLGDIWANAGQLKSLPTDPPHSAVIFIGAALFVSIVAVVLLAASIMLIIRAVVLVLIMVSAPVGFVAAAIPQTQKFSSQWLNMLLSQSFFAPVYLLLVYVGLKVVNGLGTSLGAAPGSSLFAAISAGGAGNQSYGVILIVFALVIGFMVAALVAAKNMGAVGASFATNTASRAVYGTLTRGTNLIVGSAGIGARKVIQRTVGDNFVGSALNTVIAKPLEKTNFDLRRVGAGAAVRAGGATDGANAASHALAGDMAHIPQNVRDALNKNRKEYSNQVADMKLHDEAHAGNLSAESERYLNSLSQKQLEENHAIQTGERAVAEGLPIDKFANLIEKSEKLPTSTKELLINNRYEAIKEAVDTLDSYTATVAQKAEARKKIQGMDAKEIELLSQSTKYSNLFNNYTFATTLNDDQANKTKSSQKIGAVQKNQLDTKRAERFNAANIASTIGGMSPEAVSKLPGSVLKQSHVVDTLTAQQIAYLDPNKFDPSVSRDMLARLRNPANAVKLAEFETIVGNPHAGRAGSNPVATALWGSYL